MNAPKAPDQPLSIPATGLAKAEDLRTLMADLGPRVALRSGHESRPVQPEVAVKQPSKTLRYFQLDKSTGVAKTSDLRRIHAVLLKAVPQGNKTPYRARKTNGTCKRSDIHAFRDHWLRIFQATDLETA
jgi:hypothetical protein